METSRNVVVFFLLLLVSGACAPDDAETPLSIIAYDYDFKESDHGWVADFAEFPSSPEEAARFELEAAYTEDLAETSILTNRSFMLSGNNVNGDLFMFVKKKVGGLMPDTDYTVTFNIDLTSQVDPNAAGTGSVYLKAGASRIEPMPVEVEGHYRLNIDKGNHQAPGEDMVLLGDILQTSRSSSYVLLNRNNTMANSRYVARSNASGEIWLIVGTDSSWKGSTTVFFKRIQVVFSAS